MQEELRRKQEKEDMEREEQSRKAREPRHEALDLNALGGEEQNETDATELMSTLSSLANKAESTSVELGSMTDEFFDKLYADTEVTELQEQLSCLRIVSRAKVTQDRVYSAIYHGDATKDLIFFGGEHHEVSSLQC
jgi:hypothetical protein